MKAYILLLCASMANCAFWAFGATMESGHPFDGVHVGQGGQTSTVLHLNLEWWLYAFSFTVFSAGLLVLAGSTILPVLLPPTWRKAILRDWNKS